MFGLRHTYCFTHLNFYVHTSFFFLDLSVGQVSVALVYMCTEVNLIKFSVSEKMEGFQKEGRLLDLHS